MANVRQKTRYDRTPRHNSTISPERYARMVKAFIETDIPTAKHIAAIAKVSVKLVYIALKVGWPELGLPPLGEAEVNMADPANVHEMMAGLVAQKKQIFENLFGKAPKSTETTAISQEAKQEATTRAAEHGMAARVVLSSATKAGQAVADLADWALEKIANGEVEYPEKLRLEHILMLAKATDISASAVMKALQTEKLRNGEPTDVAHQNVLILLQNASPEQLKQIALTGDIPQEMMTADNSGKKVVEALAANKS